MVEVTPSLCVWHSTEVGNITSFSTALHNELSSMAGGRCLFSRSPVGCYQWVFLSGVGERAELIASQLMLPTRRKPRDGSRRGCAGNKEAAEGTICGS